MTVSKNPNLQEDPRRYRFADYGKARRSEDTDVHYQREPEFTASGRALLVTSHDDDFVRNFASEVVILADGAVVERGDPRTVLSAPQHDATKALLRGDDTAVVAGPGR